MLSSILSPVTEMGETSVSDHRRRRWEIVGKINDDDHGEGKEDQQGEKDILERSSVGEPARRIEVKGDQQR